MTEDPVTTKHIDDVTRRCNAALSAEFGNQHYVSSGDRSGNAFAFEFWWPAYGVEGARRLKVVVSDAEHVGVENMAYPPPARAS